MKRQVAGLLTVLVLVLLVSGTRNRVGLQGTPESCIDQLYNAMKAGDSIAYLNCFTGMLREQLAQQAAREGSERFSNYLKRSAEPIKGRAVLRVEPIEPDRVRLEIDRVYQGRMWEYQGYRLERQGSRWRIYEVDPVVQHEPEIPYGTPAFSAGEDPGQGSAR